MTIRTHLKAGGVRLGNHNEALQVRSTLRAGGIRINHNEALQIRTALKAGGLRRRLAATTMMQSQLVARFAGAVGTAAFLAAVAGFPTIGWCCYKYLGCLPC